MSDNTIPVVGNYAQQWLSIHSDQLKTQFLPELYKLYGKRFDALDMLWMTGKKGLVSTRVMNLWEEKNIKGSITTSTAISTGNLGADITFKIAAGDYDANGNATVRTGQTVYIPAAYQPSTVNVQMNYQVVSKSGTAGDYTYTARPFLSTKAQIAVEVPSGTKLSLGAIQFSQGTGLPEGLTKSYYKRSFYTAILKEKLGIEGGFLSQENWTPIETNGVFNGYANKLLNDVEFRLDDQLNEYIMFGQANENAALTQVSAFGGTNKVLSGTGLWNAMDTYSQPLWYSGAFELDDILASKKLFEAQGAAYRDVIFAMGADLNDDIYRSSRDFIKEYSAGTNLLENMTSLGFTPTYIEQNGIRVNLVPLASFTNPNGMGNPVYGHGYDGFMMPTAKAKVSTTMGGDKTVMLNNVELHFLGRAGEDRTRVLGDFNGISGIQGSAAVNEYDGKTWGMLTEPMLIMTNLNHLVQVRKEA